MAHDVHNPPPVRLSAFARRAAVPHEPLQALEVVRARSASTGAAVFMLVAQLVLLGELLLDPHCSSTARSVDPIWAMLWFLSFHIPLAVTWASNPGFVDIPQQTDDGQPMEAPATSPEGIELRWCDECELWQPLRSKHCDKCDRCVRKYDHHCFWVGTCVGERNHRRFYFDVFGGCLYVSFLFRLMIGCVDLRGIASDAQRVLLQNLVALCLVILGGLMWIFCASLLAFHTYLAATAQTTWEVSSFNKITYLRAAGTPAPFSRGICANCWDFMCAYHRYATSWRIGASRRADELV